MKEIVPSPNTAQKRLAKVWFERSALLTIASLILALVLLKYVPAKISITGICLQLALTVILYLFEKPRLTKEKPILDIDPFVRLQGLNK